VTTAAIKMRGGGRCGVAMGEMEAMVVRRSARKATVERGAVLGGVAWFHSESKGGRWRGRELV